MNIYQLKVTLKHTQPPIWRRIEVASNISLGDLHEVLQGVMAWTNCHLHQFVVGRTNRRATPGEIRRAMAEMRNVYSLRERMFSDPEMGLEDTEDEGDIRLNEVLKAQGDKLLYEYDFGDGWEHDLVLEQIKPPSESERYPRCTGGKRRAPVDDCGGPWGWETLLKTVNDPKNPEYEDQRDWLGLRKGEAFDGDAFDPQEVNDRIRPRKKMGGQGGGREPAAEEPHKENTLRLISYNVVFEALPDPRYDLPEEVRSQTEKLYHLAHDHPKDAIERLESLLKKYPGTAILYNYLGAAYMRAGMEEKSLQMAEENYRRNPDYLFGKLNYAEMFLRAKNFEKVKEIMNDSWEISLHYPGRDSFHVSEILGFACVAGRYLAGVGKIESAEMYLGIIEKLHPDSPQADAVEKAIFEASLATGMKKLISRKRRTPRSNQRNKRKR